MPGLSWATENAQNLLATFSGAVEGDAIVIAVGVFDGDEVVVRHDPAPTPPDARFEIGSITKPITATLAALLAEEGKLALSDPIGKWLEAGPNGGITVEQLATHTSGLPRLAPNAMAGEVDPNNPYAHYSAELAEEGLREAVVTPGESRGYSNFGFQLLGIVIERASGSTYDELLQSRILDPLSMNTSGVRGSDLPGTRLAGYSDGREVAHWDQQLAGPGGIESSMEDLTKFLRACLEPPDSPLGGALSEAQKPRVQLDGGHALRKGPALAKGGRQQALGWTILEDGLIWKNGGTGGFRSSAVLDPATRRAGAVMVNSGDPDLDRPLVRAMRGQDLTAVRPSD